MKKLLFLFLSLAVILPACKDDDDVTGQVGNVLQYDGDNLSAPVFEVGVSEPAVYFPSSFLTPFIGKKISGIEFFVAEIPAEMEIKVLKAGANNIPGDAIVQDDITGLNIQGTSWNEWPLTDPIEITGEGLWLAIRVKHDNADERSIGCDTGPAVTNGDWIFSDTDNDWKTLRERTNNAVNINWNIRAKLID